MKRLADARIKHGLIWILPLVVLSLPVLNEGRPEWRLLERDWLLFCWVISAIADQGVNYYRRSLVAERAVSQQKRILSSLAGNIDEFTRLIRSSATKQLSEAESRALCIGLLHRIRGFAEMHPDVPEGERIRASLSVPVFDAGTVSAVQTWCYDETYSDRGWSKVSLDQEGAGRAFQTKQIQIVENLADVLEEGAGSRSYRSVVSFPVLAGGPRGKILGVVNIDAASPHVFSKEIVQWLLPFVSPAIAVIALILLSRNPGEPHVFNG